MIVTVDHRIPTIEDLRRAGNTLVTTNPPGDRGNRWLSIQITQADFVVMAIVEDGTATLVKSRHTWRVGVEVRL